MNDMAAAPTLDRTRLRYHWVKQWQRKHGLLDAFGLAACDGLFDQAVPILFAIIYIYIYTHAHAKS